MYELEFSLQNKKESFLELWTVKWVLLLLNVSSLYCYYFWNCAFAAFLKLSEVVEFVWEIFIYFIRLLFIIPNYHNFGDSTLNPPTQTAILSILKAKNGKWVLLCATLDILYAILFVKQFGSMGLTNNNHYVPVDTGVSLWILRNFQEQHLL